MNVKNTPGASTAADIAAALDKARAELVTAEAAVGTAGRAYDDGLLDLDKVALRKLLDAAAEAKIDVDQINAKTAKLEKQLEKATAAEAEDGRRAAYARAKELSEAASKKLQREYPKAAEGIRDILKCIAEADMAVVEANADLPEGVARLEGPEADRSTPTRYREERGQAVVDVWVACGDRSSPLPDSMQRQVRPEERPRRGDNTLYGRVQTASGNWLEVEKRRFTRVEYLPHESARAITSLAASLNLPALYAGESPFWEAYNHAPYQVVAELDKPLLPRPAQGERNVEVEWRDAPKGNTNAE